MEHQVQEAAPVWRLGCTFVLRQSFLRLAAFLLLGLTGTFAHALGSCEMDAGEITVAAGAMSLPLNTNVNAELKSMTSTAQMKCRDNPYPVTTDFTNYVDLSVSAAPVAGYTNVFPTNVAGLGVRYTVSAPSCVNANSVTLTNATTTIACKYMLEIGVYKPYDFKVTTTFIRTTTGPVSSGALASVPPVAVTFRSSDGSGAWSKGNLISGTASGSLSALSCSVVQRNVAVDLGATTSENLRSVGSVTPSTKFNLWVNCQAGVKVAITLTDASDANNRSPILKPASGSTAQGVGVQVLNSGFALVNYGPDSAVAGNLNQWIVGNSGSGGIVTIPLSARYIRTGALVGGTVKAIAAFTMSYQ